MGAGGIGPIADELDFGGGEDRIAVNPGVGMQRHEAAVYGARDLLEFAVSGFRVVGAKFGKIEMPLAVVDMRREPPAHRLDLGIPWIAGLVGVAVVAGFGEDALDLGGYGDFGRDVLGTGRGGKIFRGPDELEREKEQRQPAEEVFNHE